MQVIVKKGADIPFKERRAIHKLWHDTFDPNNKYKPLDSNDLVEDIFFIVKDKSKLLSVGALETVFVKFRNKKYKLRGISSVVSVVERKGYGKMIMKKMIEYVKAKNLTAVSFCSRHNTPFYKKCGLCIAKDEVKRFVHKKKDETLEKNTDDRDVIYISEDNKFMKDFLSHKKDLAYVPYFW
jgi:hypothetical protein